MKAKLSWILLISLVVCSVQLSAQSELVIDTSKNILLLKERSFGAILHTQGWGIKYSRGCIKLPLKKGSGN